MRYYLPVRYKTSRPRQRSSGMFHVGMLMDRRGRMIYPRYRGRDAAILDQLRKGRFQFEIFVPGKLPPVEIWQGRYLLVTPKVASTHLKMFLPQIEAIPVEVVDTDTGHVHSMLLLQPVAVVKAFRKAIELDVVNEPRQLKQVVDWGDENGAALGYELSASVLDTHDIVLISNAPTRIIAISERFRLALRRAFPKGRFIDFRDYSVRPPTHTSRRPARSTR